TNALPCSKAARQISVMASAWLKSIATSQFRMADSIESPRSHRAAMSAFGSSFATSTMVLPMRPAAPISKTLTRGDFTLEEPYLLNEEGLHALNSFLPLKFLERFA